MVEITAGFFHTCARLASGSVRCWGQGAYGATGHANTTSVGDDETPSSLGVISIR